MTEPSTGTGTIGVSAEGERRSRAYALGGLALGAGAGLAVSGLPWQITGAGKVGGNEFTGSLAAVLAMVSLAGSALSLLLRHRGRRVLAVPLALAGIGMIVLGVFPGATSAPTARELEEGTFWVGGITAVPWAYAVCGLLVVGGAVLMLLRAKHWPRPPDRFDRQLARASTTADDDPNEVWKALDAGHDPTLSDPGGPTSAATTAGPDDSTAPISENDHEPTRKEDR